MIFKLKGVAQNYTWGGSSFIPELIGLTNDKTPVAEYWMGAHDKAPSEILPDGMKLNDFIKKDPERVLGLKVNDRFGRLPFLFKVLDVKDMLSIQVHPSKAEAEKGFSTENFEEVPISATNRNYKDDNHKPEIMVALSEFWLLHGFKQPNLLEETLNHVPELNHLLTIFIQYGYRELYKSVMEESAEQTNKTLKPLIERILPAYKLGKLDKSRPEYWAAKAFLTFCSDGSDLDKGIYSIFFFNIVQLKVGEAIFQDAGVPHAYMEGQNIELMANSDNVLRGGLTPKHVDVPELLKHVVFNETIPSILHGDVRENNYERVYKTPAPDFELTKIDLLEEAKLKSRADSLEIGIVYKGEVYIDDDENSLKLNRGEVFAATADSSYSAYSKKESQVFMAKCPN